MMRVMSVFVRPSFQLMTILFCMQASMAQGPPPASVRVDPAKLEMVQQRRMVTGELRAVRRALVATQEPGLVIEFAVEQGQLVRKGDVLARLDPKRLELELLDVQAQEQSAIAAVDERRAELEWRQRDLETYQTLSQRSASNPKELYDAQAQAAIARAKLAAAEREVAVMRARAQLLERRVRDTDILAPFDGIIVAKQVEIGEWLAEGDEIVEIISTGPIEAWVDVPQQYADAILGAGQTPAVSITVDALGTNVDATSVRAVPLISSTARSFSLIAKLENAGGTLAPGMSVTGWVPTGQHSQELTISKNAVMRNEAGPFVYVARGGAPGAPASATPTPVQILFSDRDRFVVRAPAISSGDLLVVEGNERLFPMAPINPVVPDDGSQGR
jgi:RND family efflux transporter MFP subunit